MPCVMPSLIRIGLCCLAFVALGLGSVAPANAADEKQPAVKQEKIGATGVVPKDLAKVEDTVAPKTQPVAAPAAVAPEKRGASNDMRLIRYGRQQRIYGVR